MERPSFRTLGLAVLIALLAAAALAACGSDDENDDAAGSEGDTPTEQAEEPTATTDVTGSSDEDEETPTPEESPEPTTTPTTAPATAEDDQFPVTMMRSDGVELTIEQRPERIVSLSPGATDTLFSIGAGDQLAAVDLFSDYPEEAQELPKVDAYEPDPETIVELEPDIVFVIFDAGGIVETLENLGIPVFYLEAPRSIEELIEQIRVYGEATGNVDTADELADSLDERVAAVTEQIGDVENGPRIYHELDQEFFTVGPGSFIGDLYEILGAENIADGSLGDYPQLSQEVIIERNPEVIILPTGNGETFTSPEDVKARPGWDVIDAVENDRIHEIDQDIISRPGPRIIDALEQLAELLYPEEFAGNNEHTVGQNNLRPAA